MHYYQIYRTRSPGQIFWTDSFSFSITDVESAKNVMSRNRRILGEYNYCPPRGGTLVRERKKEKNNVASYFAYL